jgi:N,N'-diacetyllegionaminate synthase
MAEQSLGNERIIMKNLREYGFNTDNKTYVIAEIGINHGGDLDLAKRIIYSASKTGCDAVKFQTYLTEKRAPKGNQEVFDILKKCELPFSDFEILKNHSQNYGLDFFSTPFDKESIECLESIDVDLYKVASVDVVNKQLLQELAKTDKPVIMSVGMANLEEIREAHAVIKTTSNNLAILHCISAYPTEEKDANLGAIRILQDEFSDCVIGQSDHTSGIKVPLYAVALGSQIIEKHFKIDDEMDCIDAAVSITEKQTKRLVDEIRILEMILGSEEVDLTVAEKDSYAFRRKLPISVDPSLSRQ